MTRHIYGIAAAILLCAVAAPAWSQQFYLYAPKAVSPEENIQKSAGILVREVQVRKGDTLSGLSRKFSGRGSYYPQILLFNEIKDPNKIYTGDTLRLPVKPKHASLRKQKSTGPAPNRAAEASASTPPHPQAHVKAAAPAKQAKAAKQPAADVDTSAGQKLFERAIKAYRQDDCRTALELFDRFLAENPASPLAADANLYKAECYLKQSGQ